MASDCSSPLGNLNITDFEEGSSMKSESTSSPVSDILASTPIQPPSSPPSSPPIIEPLSTTKAMQDKLSPPLPFPDLAATRTQSMSTSLNTRKLQSLVEDLVNKAAGGYDGEAKLESGRPFSCWIAGLVKSTGGRPTKSLLGVERKGDTVVVAVDFNWPLQGPQLRPQICVKIMVLLENEWKVVKCDHGRAIIGSEDPEIIKDAQTSLVMHLSAKHDTPRKDWEVFWPSVLLSTT